jgi:PAS domain S-box-containing protein
VGLRRGFLTKIAVLIAVTLGSMVLAGWLWGIRPLTSLIPNYATMKPNTAFCFVVAGLALWLLRRPSTRVKSANPFHPPWGQICAFLVALVGVLTLGEYCLKLNFGIDEMLLQDPWTDLRVSPAGRMSIATAFGFFMLGSSLFFLGRKTSQDAIASQILALSGLVAAIFACLGYVYGDHGPYVVSFYTTIAVHTAMILAVLCVGTLLARPDQGMMSVLTSDYAGGRLARLILPWVLILPFSIGWLRLLGEHAGLYGTEYGLALFATSNLIIFATLVWMNAKSLNGRAAELRQGAHRYGFLADVMPQIVWTAKPDGNIDYYNQRWFDYTGMSLEQTQGQGWQPVVHPDDLQNCVEHWTKAIATGREYEVEYRFKRASDGAYRWHLGRAFPLRGQTGKIIQWVGTSTDINDQKRARDDL